ncbi:MAG TPA: hypothetical protein DEP45_11365 [Armatimonadetes bacterium]|nr:hypothetical protein [Armatimonadota bacterium]
MRLLRTAWRAFSCTSSHGSGRSRSRTMPSTRSRTLKLKLNGWLATSPPARWMKSPSIPWPIALT